MQGQNYVILTKPGISLDRPATVCNPEMKPILHDFQSLEYYHHHLTQIYQDHSLNKYFSLPIALNHENSGHTKGQRK